MPRARVLRSLVVPLVIGAMVLADVGSASAATVAPAPFSDVPASSPYAVAVGFLAQEGIVGGIGGGQFGPSLPVTRAQMAKIVVGMLGGSSAAAALAATPPSFKDASSFPSWAVGYVNDAVVLGIINGYPDGTFRPNADVTVAEALAMFTRALGDTGSVTGTWPNNYTVAGFTLGIAAGTTGLSANAAALRGQIAQMAYNTALHAQYTVSVSGTATLKAGGLYGKNAATGTYPYAVSGTVSSPGPNSIAITPSPGSSATTYGFGQSVTLAGASDLGAAALDGASVTAVLDASQQINWLGVTGGGAAAATTAEVLNDGTQTAPPAGFVVPAGDAAARANAASHVLLIVEDSSSAPYLLFKDGTTLEYSPTTTVTLNGTNFGPLVSSEDLLAPGDTVTWTTANGLATAITLTHWAIADARVTAVDASTGVLTFSNGLLGNLAKSYDAQASGATVTLNGAASTLSALASGDVVDIELKGSFTLTLASAGTPTPAIAVRASDKTVSGNVTGVNTSVGASGSPQTTLTLQTSSGAVSVVEAPGFTGAQPTTGGAFTVYLDAGGQAAYATPAAPTEVMVWLTSTGSKSTSSGTQTTLSGIGPSGPFTYTEPSNFPVSVTSSDLNKFWLLGVNSSGELSSAQEATQLTPPSGDTLKVQSATTTSAVIEAVNGQGAVDTSTFSDGLLAVTLGGAWSSTHAALGFGGLQAGDPVTVYDAGSPKYYAIVDQAR